MPRTVLKEIIVLAVDVSEAMEPYLKALKGALSTLIVSKIFHKPEDEVALLLFGTDSTKNVLHTEFKSRKKLQYLNITEIFGLNVPHQKSFRLLDKIKTEHGKVDYIDVLTVAIEIIKSRLSTDDDAFKFIPRILMFSDFKAKFKPAKREFLNEVEHQMIEECISVEAFSIDIASPDIKEEPMDIKKKLGLMTPTVLTRRITSEAELHSLFPSKPTSGIAMYRGPLEIGDMMSISVIVHKKTAAEKLPSLKPYSSKLRSSNASHEIVRETELKNPLDPSGPIPEERHCKAYLYGADPIPIPDEIQRQMVYAPLTKGVRLVGFVPGSQIPRHHFLKDAFVVLPETSKESQSALSALARGLQATGKVAIVHCYLRKGSLSFIGVMSPFIDRGRQPDAFLLNMLPFHEDIREFTFGSFSTNESLQPTDEQLDMMSRIVTEEAKMESVLPSDQTNHPIVQRFYRYLGKRSFKDVEEDELFTLAFDQDITDGREELGETLSHSAEIFRAKRQKTEDD